MFATRNKTEGTAAQAWDYLSSAMASAGESAKETAGDIADKAGKKGQKLATKANKQSQKVRAKAEKRGQYLGTRASDAADEAWYRANAAAAALAGRRSRRPWGLVAGVGLLGVAIGWAAASSARAAMERQAEAEELELADTAVVVTPRGES
jgi:ElaB/YqjD/DUF883 family membrane-anchored ribosome-binding protein